MSFDFLSSEFAYIGAGLIAAVSVVLALAARRANRQLQQRCDRLEQSLRAFSGANSGIGRQVTALDAGLQQLRVRLMHIEGRREAPMMAAAAPASPVIRERRVADVSSIERATGANPFEQPAASVHAAESEPLPAMPDEAEQSALDDDERFSAAELQLAELLKQRMGSLRAAVGS